LPAPGCRSVSTFPIEAAVKPTVLVNGEPAGHIAVADRGFQYGDGIFTTLPVRHGMPLLWLRHLDRLERDAARLLLPPPDRAALTGDVRRLLAEPADGVLKIQLTRGSGGRGYRPPDPVCPTRVVALHPPPALPPDLQAEGGVVRVCRTRLGCNPALAGIKHLNRLEQVLARAEWADEHIREGLMLDGDGHLVEGTMSNLFLVQEGRLRTPRLDRCGVAGVMRALVLEGANGVGLPAEEGDLAMADLLGAEEAFLTNCVIGLWPIRRLENRDWPLGPVSRALARWLAERIARESNAWCG
jgi:4-amino-4-deoxychorismate lyase